MTVPGAAPDEDVVEINDCVVETLENVLHQAREGRRTRFQPHRCDCPHELAPARHGEHGVLLTLLSQLELPVRIDEVQCIEELGLQSPEPLETTCDIHKQMEVIPDYLVDLAHVDDEPQLVAVLLLDGENWRIMRASPVLPDRPQR